jgi:hypothetical protein
MHEVVWQNVIAFTASVKAIIRTKRTAEIIMSYDEQGRPLRLPGFVTHAKYPNSEVCEQGFEYFQRLISIAKQSNFKTLNKNNL